jgi:hypothetical protein
MAIFAYIKGKNLAVIEFHGNQIFQYKDNITVDTSNQKNRDTNAEKNASPVNETTKTFSHKYKWTFEEIGMIAALFVGLIFTFVGYFNKQFDVPAFIVLLVVVVGLLTYLFIIGFGRKKKSRLIATYDTKTTELVVEGNGYKPELNHGLLHNAVSASEKRVGINDTLAIQFKDRAPLYVPARIAGAPGLYEILEDVLVNKTNISSKNPQVEEFLEKAKNYKK